MQMKIAAMNGDKDEALRFLKILLKRMEKQEHQIAPGQ